MHADGDNKDKLYCNDLVPERFGRHREYALGKNSGKANIIQNLNELGLELTPEQTKAFVYMELKRSWSFWGAQPIMMPILHR